MTLGVFLIVLAAAAIHATWNAILKGAGNTLMMTVMVVGFSGAVAAVALFFVPPPATASLPWLGVSFLLEIVYYVLLANAYRVGDMSRTYPIMRGTAPLIVVVVSTTLLGEEIGLAGWAGVGLICLGLLSLVIGRQGAGRLAAPGTGFALLNAVVIASYTLVDGVGIRAAGSPAYTFWLFVLIGVPLLVWALAARRRDFIAALRTSLPQGLVAGIGNLTSYGLVLWAMTQAPVPFVAALRETSILFGTAIAVLFLRERVHPLRAVAVLIVAAGAIALRLA